MKREGKAMNIFEMQRNDWWEHMELVMQNVNLNEIGILQNNNLIFTFLNSYNGKYYGKICCDSILKCCIENSAFENEEFAYFIPDVFLKKLSKVETESSLTYYRYGYNVDFSKLSEQYLVLIIGGEIYIDVVCGKVDVLLDKGE